MDKTFQPAKFEEEIYNFWEENDFFKAKVDKDKKPFSIILPPPNANADLHLGHAMYVYEDVMIRYHKLLGWETLWLPGADHAGFETQFVFEKQLQKEGKSRFDFDRETLFKMIFDFVIKNKGNMENQLRRLGFVLDWTKEKFTLDADVVKIVYQTFKKLYDEGLIYREKRLVNYCVRDGTSFSDLEVQYVERQTPLYYIKYGPFVLATTRPETKFGDTAVAVHPDDKRYQKWVGREIEVEGLMGKFKLKVIGDEFVDPKFGTGVVKVTPAHDFTDFEVGRRHKLTMKQVIGYDGKLNEHAGKYQGLFVTKARKIIVEDLKRRGLLEKVKEDYTHRIGVCYKCGTTIEPLLLEQWYVKIRPLADEAKTLVTKEQIKILPKRFKKVLLQWLANFHDWNISRQIVWGMRIPAWQCKKCKEWTVTDGKKPNKCSKCGGTTLEQDADTFDTWFSSSQWPFATLQTQPDKNLYEYFYPTKVMETGYDILPWWVARMIMIGYFATKKAPFQTVFLHGLVRDKKGQKMSKSKDNVINPMKMISRYGADALRSALIFGTKEGNDISFAEEKVVGMRNFTNKVWNIGRFIHLNSHPEHATRHFERSEKSQNREEISRSTRNDNKRHSELSSSRKRGSDKQIPDQAPTLRTVSGQVGNDNKIVKELLKEFGTLKKKYLKHMDKYELSKALDVVYEFLWHRFADFYIEELKEELKNGNMDLLEKLKEVYSQTLKLLHPFMPFVTEAVWQSFYGKNKSILNEKL